MVSHVFFSQSSVCAMCSWAKRANSISIANLGPTMRQLFVILKNNWALVTELVAFPHDKHVPSLFHSHAMSSRFFYHYFSRTVAERVHRRSANLCHGGPPSRDSFPITFFFFKLFLFSIYRHRSALWKRSIMFSRLPSLLRPKTLFLEITHHPWR